MAADPDTDVDCGTDSLWLAQAVERGRGAGLRYPLLASVVLFGTLPTAGLAWLLVSQWGRLPPGFVAGTLGVGVWLNLAPYLVWRYDARTFPEFLHRVADVIDRSEDDSDTDDDPDSGDGESERSSNDSDPGDDSDRSKGVPDLTAEYERVFVRRWWVPAVPTTALGVPMMVFGRPFLRAAAEIDPADPLYWVVFGVVLWLGVLIGIGLAGVRTSLRVVRVFTDCELDLDPLHPDRKGGLSAIGWLAVRTTLLLSMGSFLLPIQFHFVAFTGGAVLQPLIYLLVVGYAAVIFLSFAVPVALANRRAEQLREQRLEGLRTEYHEAKAQAQRLTEQNSSREDRTAAELRVQRVREEYKIYDTVTLYPTDLSVLSRLAASVVFPLVLTLVDAFVRRELLVQTIESVL